MVGSFARNFFVALGVRKIQTVTDVRCRTRARSDVRIDVARRTINSCPVELSAKRATWGTIDERKLADNSHQSVYQFRMPQN